MTRSAHNGRRFGLLPLWLVVGGWLLAASTAGAHDLRPGAVALRETTPGQFAFVITPPEDGGARAVSVQPRWPAGCALTAQGSLGCSGDLAGQLEIPGLERRRAKLLVHVDWLPTATGAPVQWQQLLREGETTVVIPGRKAVQGTDQPAANAPPAAWLSWLLLGIEHILLGVDHLLFVLGLALVSGWNRRLLMAVTAFTLAHSVILAAAALGWVVAPGAAVELMIAASVLLLAAEAARGVGHSAAQTATQRWPALVALLFGLVHGFGFAGAIASLGLPREGTLVALLAFNGGIELGQLSVLAVLSGLTAASARLLGPARTEVMAPRAHMVVAYGMGSVAGVWTISRALTWWLQVVG